MEGLQWAQPLASIDAGVLCAVSESVEIYWKIVIYVAEKAFVYQDDLSLNANLSISATPI